MNEILKIVILSILVYGTISILISYNTFFDLNLYKVNDGKGNTEKFYIINEEKAKDIFNNYEIANDEEEFNIIKFFEKLNGDFKFEY